MKLAPALLAAWVALCATSALLAGELRVAMLHTFAGESLQMDSLRYPGASGETAAISRLSYLLSGFALQAKSGEWIELPDAIAWVDAERRRTSFSLSKVPPGSYSALRFAVGLNAALNHSSPETYADGHPLNPNLSGLHWGWQGGYVFLALEGRFRAGAQQEPEGFVYHLARDANRTVVTVSVAFDLENLAELPIEFDLAKLLGKSDALSPARDGSATHSRDGDPAAERLKIALTHAFRALPASAAGSTSTAEAPPADPQLPAKYTPYRFTFDRNFPRPELPRDNPLIEERVRLGQMLFSDPQLSRDGTVSCATCHRAEHAFAEPERVSRGVAGRSGERNAMPLFNLAWKSSFFWDGRASSLREQALIPIQEHREMDLTMAELLPRLRRSDTYRQAFAAAFSSGEITCERIGLALEQFLLTLVAGTSKFDHTMRGAATLSAAEQRGFELFMTEFDPRTGQRGADCFHCHGGPLFTDHQLHNNGLPVLGNDTGRELVTQAAADRGKFAAPSLRNLSRTAPYMHDGRFTTLEEVIAHYNGPIERTPTLDPNLAKHPAGGLRLTPADQAALASFLRTLNDE